MDYSRRPGCGRAESSDWAANVDASGFGLGVFQPEVNTFIAGFHGRRGVGGAFDDDTGYISPIRPEQLDWNIVYDYPYSLVVGTVEEIRAYAVSHRPPAPSWQFTTSREGFSLVNASDTGFPIHDLLRVRLNQADPQAWSPPSFWRAEDVPAVDVRMALHGTSADRAEAFWAVDGRGFSGSQRDAIAVVPDGAFHTYRIPLAGAAGYTGAITRFRFDPIVTGETPGAYAEIDAISRSCSR